MTKYEIITIHSASKTMVIKDNGLQCLTSYICIQIGCEHNK